MWPLRPLGTRDFGHEAVSGTGAWPPAQTVTPPLKQGPPPMTLPTSDDLLEDRTP